VKIFIDTSAFIAHLIKQEIDHDEVLAKYNLYRNQKAIFLTSNYVIDELLTWFVSHQNKISTQKLVNFLEKLTQSKELRVLYIDQTTDSRAQAILLKFFEHKISFTDATTYVLYKDFKIDEIFTLDRNFKRMRLTTSF